MNTLVAFDSPSDKDVVNTLFKFGADCASIVRKDDKMFIAIYRHKTCSRRRRSCGRIYKGACCYLLERFQEYKIFVLESPRLYKECQTVYVREPFGTYFVKTSLQVTEDILW